MNARRMFDTLVQKKGVALKPKLEINEIHTLLHLVRTDRWVAILVDSIIHDETGLCAVPFREAALPMRLSFGSIRWECIFVMPSVNL